MNKETLEELKELLLEYDKYNGPWPEHEYEGLHLFLFLESKLQGKDYRDFTWASEEVLEKWRKEMELIPPLMYKYGNGEERKID